MTKGTHSMGKRSRGKTHIPCRRCGNTTYHVRKKRCSYCSYGASARMRSYSWQKK
ncbi:50S ribosomal protein L37e [Candidatus Woesearchaeota archaeon]|nr:50S ribosomal protein L37e [Candidatus Woesearchaeota archaeon]